MFTDGMTVYVERDPLQKNQNELNKFAEYKTDTSKILHFYTVV